MAAYRRWTVAAGLEPLAVGIEQQARRRIDAELHHCVGLELGVSALLDVDLRAAFAGDPRLASLTVAGGERASASGVLEGDINPFIRALAAFTVVDLRVEEPDLEEAVLGLYAKQV